MVAGFTNRDQNAARAHVEELAAHGVRAPSKVPAYYLVSPGTLTQDDNIIVTHRNTSGEVEIALLVDGENIYVTLASDHTDRDVEAVDIALSKRVCPKVLGRKAWTLEEVRSRWNSLAISSWIHENGRQVLYQSGLLSQFISPDELLNSIPFEHRLNSFVLLGGTLPTIGGLRASDHFWAELRDPHAANEIQLDYRIQTLDPLKKVP